jgi:hypothetical protein
MTWILVLAFAALATAVAIAARRGLIALQDSRQQAWHALEAQLGKRAALATALLALCAKPLGDSRTLLERAGHAGSAVLAAARQQNAPAVAAADKSHRAAFEELFRAAAQSPQLAGSDAFRALRERMATLDARVDERREAYNQAVSVLNFRCRAFPYRLLARSMGVEPAPILP